MRLIHKNKRLCILITTLYTLLCAISGCAVVGPKSISSGRMQYNEVINKTEDEQMLLAIVKSRYEETFSLLAVNGIAANVRFSTNTAIQAGFGPKNNYVGELTPFSAGMSYEENPTITYAPIQGEQYLRQLMSPIPLDLVVLISRSGTYPARYYPLLINRVNDLENPEFLNVRSERSKLQFQRFVELSDELEQAGIIDIVEDPKDNSFDLLMTDYSPAHIEIVREYLALLGISISIDESEDIIIPVYFAIKKGTAKAIAISTRSTYDLLEILSAAIDIPAEHVEAGFARKYPEMGLAGKNLTIHASKNKPKQALVAVQHHDYWFYIDHSDMNTKQFYVIVRTLWSVSMAAASDKKVAPVLTIPVGG